MRAIPAPAPADREDQLIIWREASVTRARRCRLPEGLRPRAGSPSGIPRAISSPVPLSFIAVQEGLPSGAVSGLTYRECRSWVERLPRTREAKQAQGRIRPRSLGLYRVRPPLPVLLYLADREGRLVGRSADAFAVIEPPIARNAEWHRAMRNRPGWVRALGRLVRAWPFILPYAPAVIAMLVAVPLALVSGRAHLLLWCLC